MTIKTMLPWLMAAVLAAPGATDLAPLQSSTNARADVAVANDDVVLDFGPDGMPMGRFVETYVELTGLRVTYDQRRLANVSIRVAGPLRFPRERAADALGALLMASDIAVVPVGEPDLALVQFEDVKTSQSLKQNARWATVDDVLEGRARPNEVVAVVLTLKNTHTAALQRVLSNLIQDHRVGFVMPHEASNSLILVNFAKSVETMLRIALALDSIEDQRPDAAPAGAAEDGDAKPAGRR
ncbi:MAG: hypothetical protein R3F20_12710 [Planctomycetota bacterium]